MLCKHYSDQEIMTNTSTKHVDRQLETYTVSQIPQQSEQKYFSCSTTASTPTGVKSALKITKSSRSGLKRGAFLVRLIGKR